MPLKLKDVRVGDCFRYLDDTLNEGAVAYYADTRRNPVRPNDLPPGWGASDVDDQGTYPDWWRDNGDDPVELLEHYTRAPKPEVLRRVHIRVGECFQYIGKSSLIEMVDDWERYPRHKLPTCWWIAEVGRCDLAHARVRRIPHWTHVGAWTGLPPRNVLAEPSVVAPAGVFTEEADGLTGAECLARLEKAMQTESLCVVVNRAPARSFVSTHGEASLTEAQVCLGRRAWAAKLAELQAKARATDAARAVSVVTDSGDDDPNPWWPRTDLK